MTKDALREHLRKLGAKGGKATAKNRTKQERKDAARHAANVRWGKYPVGNPDHNSTLAYFGEL